MSEFADFLKKEIKDANISIVKLSKLSGIERTSIQKMLTDSRFPTNDENVMKIAQALSLNSVETKELMKRYIIYSLGEISYSHIQDIKDFIIECDKLGGQSQELFSIEERTRLILDQETVTIRGADRVIDTICGLLQHEAQSDGIEISIILQPENRDILKCLTKIGKKENKIKVQHLICMDNNKSHWNDKIHNVSYLKNILPLIAHYDDYQIFYYYDNIASHINENTLMPYMILTKNYVCLLSYDMESAVFTKNQDMISLYRKQFRKQLEKTSPLLKSIAMADDYNESFILGENDINQEGKLYSIEHGPCVGPYITEEMVHDCVIPEFISAEIAWKMISSNAQNIKKLNEKRGYCFYFSDDGLDEFITARRISYLPECACLPFSAKHIYQLLTSVCGEIETGVVEAYMVNSDVLTALKNVFIETLGKNHTQFFIKTKSGDSKCIKIKEKKTCNSFYEYMEYLKHSDCIYTKTEMIEYLQDKLRTLRMEI